MGGYSITHVTPDVLRFRQKLVQVIQELACRVQVHQIDQRVGRASVVRAHGDIMLGARGQAIPLHHSGNQRSGHDGTGKESKKSKRLCNVKPGAPDRHSCGGLPPRVVGYMSDESRTRRQSEQRSLLLHCP